MTGTMARTNGWYQLGSGDLRLLLLPLWPTNTTRAIVCMGAYWHQVKDALIGGFCHLPPAVSYIDIKKEWQKYCEIQPSCSDLEG